MKTIKKLVLVSALIITSGTLFALSVTDTSKGTVDPQFSEEETMYFGEDVEIVEKANKILHESKMAFENVMKDPENSIPPSLLSQSEGMVIFPRAFKLALGVAGGQGARGIAMIRLDDGTWSNPFFISMGEASVGIQIGAQKSDIVLLFSNRNDILAIDEAAIMLGSGIGVAAGPKGKGSISNPDVNFDAEIYSYQRSKGLFAGLSFNGGVLSENSKFNETLYCMNDITPEEIINDIEAPFNKEVKDLIETLNMYGE